MVSKTWKQAADEWRKQFNEITLVNCNPINDDVLHLVAKSCSGLHTLDLGTCGVNEMGIATRRSVNYTAAASEAVAKGCLQLRNLNFAASCRIASDESMDEKVLPFVQYCPHWFVLDVRHCCTGDNVLQGLANHCPDLQHLHLSGTDITNDGLLVVAENCLKLKILCIAQTNCTALALKAGFPELRHLDVCTCEMKPAEVFTAVIGGCPKLEQLVGDSERIYPHDIDMLILLRQRMPWLEIDMIWLRQRMPL